MNVATGASVTEDRYANHQRLRFDRPHPKVLRTTMDDIGLIQEMTTSFEVRARVWKKARAVV